ncbi:hypothetical protein [Sphingomonas turrisvirgatae]|uniref:Uncharacterized protein n=1 Tax=Sphingomonas turrisvirgatae TaxID=1888892 RepID=A0A1E3LZ18_9SPHN|nr:hypothetical protein [Sphingomonas turrisvirgatae]ODP39026.1 hypothetical protein BFL28_12300 [Sphingomonas turrisvirgatae]
MRLRLPTKISSRGALSDLRETLRMRHGYQWGFMGAALVVTVLILAGLAKDAYFERPYKREIVYVQNWRADRSLEEIVAQQKIDQAKREKVEAEARAKAEKRRLEWKKIDDNLKSYGI